MVFREEEEEAIRQEQENQECESEDENGSENKGPWAPLSSSPPKTFSSSNNPKSNGTARCHCYCRGGIFVYNFGLPRSFKMIISWLLVVQFPQCFDHSLENCPFLMSIRI